MIHKARSICRMKLGRDGRFPLLGCDRKLFNMVYIAFVNSFFDTDGSAYKTPNWQSAVSLSASQNSNVNIHACSSRNSPILECKSLHPRSNFMREGPGRPKKSWTYEEGKENSACLRDFIRLPGGYPGLRKRGTGSRNASRPRDQLSRCLVRIKILSHLIVTVDSEAAEGDTGWASCMRRRIFPGRSRTPVHACFCGNI